MKNTDYKICSACVMDTTDEDINFDSNGVCNHCREFKINSEKRWYPGDEGKEKLLRLFEKIKKEGRGKKYDCILGLSGGLDSSYLALILKDNGLRPLVVHVDAGWNTEAAVSNIEAILDHCNFELYTKVVDWEDMKSLQLAYLKSGVANQDVPQDHAFFANLYHFATENNINYVINGTNIATESIFPAAWHHAAMDEMNLLDIYKKYGYGRLNDYRTVSFFKYYFYYPFFKKMKVVHPLDFMPYSKDIALNRLKEIGYKPYERKHGESHFTKFFQNHFLPIKFKFDKRRPHFSSLIVSGLMTRDEAINKLNEPLYNQLELKNDMDFVAKKLNISVAELNEFINSPCKHYSDYKNWDFKYKAMKKIQKIISKITKRKLGVYS
jgi:N-acetyl sugar amidotransferase